MCLCHATTAMLNLQPPTEGVGIAVLVVASVFVAAFAVGWGPVPWTLCSEIFPMRVRSRATSVTTATNWLANTLLGKAFPLLPLATAFGLFALVCVCGVTLSYLAQPETANLSLEQIDVAFATHKPRARRRFWEEASRNAEQDRLRLVRKATASDCVEATTVTAEDAVESHAV